MQIQERFIVPGLGLVIFVSIFLLGVPLAYKVLLGLIGLGAFATYFAPRAVQVEIRIAIAALGLIILLINSPAFWLALMSLGAIAALQVPLRHTLQRSPATIEWLNTVLQRLKRRSGEAADSGVGEEAGASQAGPTLLGGVTLPGFVRMNAAGIGGLVAGVLVLASVFMPWYGFLVSGYGAIAGSENLTLRAGAEELGLPALTAFFIILIMLGVSSIISIGIPRVVGAIIAAAGFIVTLASYFYVFAEVEREAAELSSIGVDVTAIPAVGCLLAGVVFLVMFVLHLIPGLNRSWGKG